MRDGYRGILIASLVLFASLVSCKRPASVENFIRVDEAPDSLYSFSLNLYDTLHTWDVLFYAAGVAGAGLDLDIRWTSPAPDTLVERVYVPCGESDGCTVPYRTGVSPAVPGIHRLDVRVIGAPDDFRGLGVICRTN